MYTDDTITLKEIWHEAIFLKSTIQEYITRKKKEREEAMLKQHRLEERRRTMWQ
jgi:hypothetical protein